MTFVKHRLKEDCGVCSVAMLLGITWEKAAELMFGPDYTNKEIYPTNPDHVIRAFEKVGVSYEKKDFAKMVSPEEKILIKTDWKNVPNNSVVFAVSTKLHGTNPGNQCHAFVKKYSKIYDPSLGIVHPKKFDELCGPWYAWMCFKIQRKFPWL